jgi:excisionase family DNA binding protein
MIGRRSHARGAKRPVSEPIYTIPEIADALGVCSKTVRREIERGALKAVRVGRQIRIKSGDFAAYLNRCSDVHT